MHEFLIDFRVWQNSKLKDSFKIINEKEKECVDTCKGY